MDIAIPIFETTFPNSQALFLFDHATSHTAYAEDALLVDAMNLDSGGKQSCFRDGWYYKPDRVQLIHHCMNFAPNDTTVSEELRGKPKGICRVLLERGLWPYDKKLRLDCRTREQKESKEHDGTSCCARQLLSEQAHFQSQRSRLQEKIENRGHLCLFFPKYHCELN